MKKEITNHDAKPDNCKALINCNSINNDCNYLLSYCLTSYIYYGFNSSQIKFLTLIKWELIRIYYW